MMKQLIPMDEYGMFANMKDAVLVDSRFVAQYFEKRHDNVLKDIRELDCSKEFRLLNFEESSYLNAQGKKQPCYYMTRDGFVFLVMGYRGSKAAHFKEQYIRRFNELESHVASLVSAREQFPKLTAQIHFLHPDAKPYYYSNECDMLYRIVLGQSAKQYRETHGLEKKENIRPHLRQDQIAMLDLLQTVDIGLLLAIPDYQQRKRQLEWYAMSNAGKFGTTKESVALLTNNSDLDLVEEG